MGDRQEHDAQIVVGWRENLLRVVTEAELAFRTVEAGWDAADAAEWAAVLERRMNEVHRRTDALRAHMAHAYNLAELDKERQ